MTYLRRFGDTMSGVAHKTEAEARSSENTQFGVELKRRELQ
jgi:hypothetical protein